MMATLAHNKRKGVQAEVVLCDWLIAQGYDVARIRLAGTSDEGDLLVMHGNATVTVVEVKNCTKLAIGAWLAELDLEMANTRTRRPGVTVHGVLVVRPRGTTDPSRWWRIQRLGHGGVL